MADQFAEAFTHLTTKDGRVLVRWHGQQIATIAGLEANQLAAKLAGADRTQRQQILAAVAGNLRRREERPLPKK